MQTSNFTDYTTLYERFTFHSHALPEDHECKVVRFQGTEGLGKLYDFTIQLLSRHPLNTDALLSAPCMFRIDRKKASPAFFHGYLTSVSQGQQIQGWTVYTVHLEPQLAKLKNIVQNCIYLNKNIQQILEEAWGNCGILKPTHTFTLHNSYPVHEFCMQYNENVYDYTRSLIEREGIYYFFDQQEDREHIIFTDAPMTHTHMDGLSSLRYYPTSGLEGGHYDEVITTMTRHQVPLPKEIYVRDYDWKNPTLTIEATATVDANGLGSLFFYSDGFSTSPEGKRLAEIRADALRCRSTLYHGTSSVPLMRPGYIFTLTDHYDEDWNTTYFTTDTVHEGSQEGYLSSVLGVALGQSADSFYYRNSFTCIKEGLPFRLERKTERRKIPGVIHAFIDASSDSPTPEIDNLGRYKVVFPQDTSGRASGKASCWIRRAQPSVGAGYGTSFPLDPGVEVIIAFLDGNPDRPFIAGALGNPQTGFTDNATNAMFSGMTSACGGALTFNDSPQKQGFNLSTGSGRSGMFMSSGSLDQAFLRTDNYTQFSTVAATNFATLFTKSSSGTFNELSVLRSLAPATIMTTASGVLANVTETLRQNNADAAAGASSVSDALAAQQQAAIDLQEAEVAEKTAKDYLTQCTATAESATGNEKIRAEKDLKVATLKAQEATWKREDAEKKLIASSDDISAAQDAQGKSEAAENWDIATTTLKTVGALGATMAHAYDTWGGSIGKMPSPYGAVLGASDAKNSLRLVIEGDKLRSGLVKTFLVAYVGAQINKAVAGVSQGYEDDRQFQQDLTRETTSQQVDFLNRSHDTVLIEDKYLTLYNQKKHEWDEACKAECEAKRKEIEAQKNVEINSIPSDDKDKVGKTFTITEKYDKQCAEEIVAIKKSYAMREADLMKEAQAAVAAMTESEKMEAYEKVYKKFLSDLDASKAQKLAHRKNAQLRTTVVNSSELVAELMLNYLSYKRAVTDWDVPHGGVKIASTKNLASTSTHSYFSAADGISLLTIPQACDFVDTTPAEKHVSIHENYFGIDSEKTFIVAETEQARIVGLKDTEMFGTEHLTLRSAKAINISNRFDDAATYRDPLVATLQKMPLDTIDFINANIADADNATLSAINPFAAYKRRSFAKKAPEAIERYKEALELAETLNALPLSQAYSTLSLDNNDDTQALRMKNCGKELSIQQSNVDDSTDNLLSITYTSKDGRGSELGFYNEFSALYHIYPNTDASHLTFTKNESTVLTHTESATLELKDKVVTLKTKDDAASLEINNDKMTLKNEEFSLTSGASSITSKGAGITLDGNTIALKGTWGNFEGKSGKLTIDASGIIAIG